MGEGRHRRELTRRDAWIIALIVAIAIVGGSLLISNGFAEQRADGAAQRADTAEGRADAAVAQSKALGLGFSEVCAADSGVKADLRELCLLADRVAEQPVPDSTDTDALVSLVTARVLAAIPRPRDGADGVTPACALMPPFCQGADGVPGAAGVPGAEGQPGAEGRPGADGQPGVDGADGQPPRSWTVTRADGSVETCRRVDDFDPETPDYQCSVTSPPPEPAPGPDPLPFPLLPGG